jgi:hypothetical protein
VIFILSFESGLSTSLGEGKNLILAYRSIKPINLFELKMGSWQRPKRTCSQVCFVPAAALLLQFNSS